MGYEVPIKAALGPRNNILQEVRIDTSAFGQIKTERQSAGGGGNQATALMQMEPRSMTYQCMEYTTTANLPMKSQSGHSTYAGGTLTSHSTYADATIYNIQVLSAHLMDGQERSRKCKVYYYIQAGAMRLFKSRPH